MSQATLTPAVPKPAHIPDALVCDFDMFNDPGLLADPHERILELLRTAPAVFWTPRNGGHWVLMSHEANFTASRDTETFSSEFIPPEKLAMLKTMLPPGSPHIPIAVPINLDPPEHTKYRMPLNRVFSPKAIAALKDSIRQLAGELIDKVKADGRCEFMTAIAEPLPVQVFLKMLGLPLSRWEEYRELVREHLAASNLDPRRMMQSMMKIAASMRPTMLERRDNPQDDILSMLWKVEVDGKPTTIEDMENYGVLLFIAGLDTVMNGMGHGVRHLARNPELQAQLRANPELVGEATEELLRRYTFTVPPRILAKDVEFMGAPMKKGDKAMLYLPAADLDAREFADPERFDLNRENKVHIAFNAGPHRCLGSHLARVELQVLYEEMLARLPTFRLDPARPPKFHGGHVVGVDVLHLIWDV
ncbi:cytochrome P450 [Sinimarinibacterium thermocellulolyticum]|uniref:Cytochrome P450 n=1 Tax=Sinimarinibacterium thermocellulolyticum TaxID=3170016 RepID=A0ABV2ABN7_9GAMM